MAPRTHSSHSSMSSMPSLASSEDSAPETELLGDAPRMHQEYVLPPQSRTPSLVLAASRPLADSPSHPQGVGSGGAFHDSPVDGHTGDALALPHAPNDVAYVGSWVGNADGRVDAYGPVDIGNGDHAPVSDLLAHVNDWLTEHRNGPGKETVLDLPDATDPFAGIGSQFDGIALNPGATTPGAN